MSFQELDRTEGNTVKNLEASESKCNLNHILDNYGDLLNAQDLADIFGNTKGTIYKELRIGKFGTPLKIGRKYVIPKTAVYDKFFKVQ